MRLIRWFSAIAVTALLIIAAWLWWSRPQSIDMADYAPADALVYLECNSLLDVGDALARTDAWRDLSPLLGMSQGQPPNRWLTRVIAWTGIGPTQTVILARAQLATVMLDLRATEQHNSLTIKPEAAILIETHTSESRIRSTVEDALRLFAEKSYRQPTLRKTEVAGSELLVWSETGSERQIVATIDGTLVIVGNSERAVKTCLEVRRAQRPSLKGHPEMQEMRRRLTAADTLAFGFVSSANAPRLFSLGAPLLFGRIPGDVRFDRIITASAAKVLAGVGWSARVSLGGIEDKYLFSLQSPLVSRLQPHFRPTNSPIQVFDLLPKDVNSVSIYRFENAVATWEAVGTTLSSQLDALSAILVSSVLKSALTPYGVEEPEKFISLVGPEISTVRLRKETEQSILVAQVRDEAALRRLLLGPGESSLKRKSVGEAELIEIPGKTIAVSFLRGTVLLGPPPDLQQYLSDLGVTTEAGNRSAKLEHFLARSNSANVVTYTRDGDQVMKFVQAASRALGGTTGIAGPTPIGGTPPSGGTTGTRESAELARKIEELPYAATETTMGDQGLERTTRSSFGQFATLLPLLFPER